MGAGKVIRHSPNCSDNYYQFRAILSLASDEGISAELELLPSAGSVMGAIGSVFALKTNKLTLGGNVKRDERYYTVSKEVFDRFPGYVRGVVIAYELTNGKSPAELTSLLRSAEDSVRERLDLEKLAEHPRMASWREAYRSFGAKPSKFRPSIEAMVRRVLRNDELPSINALVDIGNVVSLNHLVPAGGHAIDVLTQDISLREAAGDEEFIPLDSDQVENPIPGEIVFVEGRIVLTRRWTWRQAKHTLVIPETTTVEMNVDGLPPVPVAEIEEACRETMELVTRFCGGNARCDMLTEENPTIRL